QGARDHRLAAAGRQHKQHAVAGRLYLLDQANLIVAEVRHVGLRALMKAVANTVCTTSRPTLSTRPLQMAALCAMSTASSRSISPALTLSTRSSARAARRSSRREVRSLIPPLHQQEGVPS